MRRILLAASVAALALTACDSARKPTAANFTAAINRYLATHGQLCIPIGSKFPIDIPLSPQSRPNGLGPKLEALQHAGLLNETDTSAVVQSLANSLSLGPHKAEQVRRYTVNADGQKYLKTVITDFGPAAGFCYGLKQVDSISKWTNPQPVGSSSGSQVTYRYRVIDLAPWASRSEIRQQFPVVMDTFNAAATADQIIGVQSTSDGWVVAVP